MAGATSHGELLRLFWHFDKDGRRVHVHSDIASDLVLDAELCCAVAVGRSMCTSSKK